ncbi:MAG: hypothetical protein QW736_01195 [Fervidicoccaceae archaeon]
MNKNAASLLILTFFIVSSPYVAISQEQTNIDCGYLLKLLNLELNYAVNYNISSGLALAQDALNMGLPSEISTPHSKIYTAFLDYFNLLENLREGAYTNESALTLLRTLINTRDVFNTTLNTYVNYLASCSITRDVANRLKNEDLYLVGMLVNTIYPNIYQSILNMLKGPELVNVDIPKKVFQPGESLVINITPLVDGVNILKVQVDHWPTFKKLSDLDRSACGSTGCIVTYRVPYLNEVKDLVVENLVQLALVVTYSFHNLNLSYTKLFEVVYGYPNVSVEVQPAINFGDNLSITLKSDNTYNVTMSINNVEVLNTSILLGANTYIIPFNSTLFKIGINQLKVVISSTSTTVQYSIEKSFTVAVKSPNIEVQTPLIVFGWRSSLPVTVVNYENKDVDLIIYVNNKEILNSTLNNSIDEIGIPFFSLFPSILKMDVYFVNEYGTQILILHKEIMYVNVSFLLAFITASILLINYIRSEFLIIPPFDISAKKTKANQGSKAASAPSKHRIKYSIKSRLVNIYYNLLNKLRLQQPDYYETLREHYRRVISKSILSEAMWRLLTIVERDLYSGDKPADEEADKIANEIAEEAERVD